MNYETTAGDYSPKYAREDAMRGMHYRDPATLSMGPQALEKRPEGGVLREMRIMDKQLQELTQRVDILCSRLSEVRVPQPNSEGYGRTPEIAASGMASQLSAFNSILNEQVIRLRELEQGLDL